MVSTAYGRSGFLSERLLEHALTLPQYQSGSMTTASRLGLSDLAFASLNDFAMNGMMIANLDPRVPLIADADTGFGAPPAIARMVQMYDRCNIAGFHIEDQVINKRCGHLKGKQLVDME
jgi:2-methylisocitrate lyase-like PEP mutase family enzyme